MQGLMDGDSHLQGCEMAWTAWMDGWHLALALACCGCLQLERSPLQLVRRASSKVL